MAVSGDVHQHRWHLLVAGEEELPDPHRRRISAAPPTAGRWVLHALLAGRPVGGDPEVVAGASPAYDLRQAAAAAVVEITVESAGGVPAV